MAGDNEVDFSNMVSLGGGRFLQPKTYKGTASCHIRTWTTASEDEDSPVRPSVKGVTLNGPQLAKLAKHLP